LLIDSAHQAFFKAILAPDWAGLAQAATGGSQHRLERLRRSLRD
jgi:hypothetical protein